MGQCINQVKTSFGIKVLNSRDLTSDSLKMMLDNFINQRYYMRWFNGIV
jgi:hypothetical protein